MGLVAGFVDAIAGGGGLIMLPGLLFSGLPVGSAIATNKLCGTFGALTSSLKFAQAKQIDWRACIVMGIPAVIGAYIGSSSIDKLPNDWAEPLVIALMVVITLFVVFNPGFGMKKSGEGEKMRSDHAASKNTTLKSATLKSTELSSNLSPNSSPNPSSNPSPNLSPKRWIFGIAAGGVIGFHDGFFGPGTGIFLVFSLLSLWSLDFLRGTGTTKVINLMTNVTALITFAAAGHIDYSKGIWGALGVGIGSLVGATCATRQGAKIIKPIFITVTIALIGKLALDYLNKQF